MKKLLLSFILLLSAIYVIAQAGFEYNFSKDYAIHQYDNISFIKETNTGFMCAGHYSAGSIANSGFEILKFSKAGVFQGSMTLDESMDNAQPGYTFIDDNDNVYYNNSAWVNNSGTSAELRIGKYDKSGVFKWRAHFGMSYIGNSAKIIQSQYSSIVTGLCENTKVSLIELDTNGSVMQNKTVIFGLPSNENIISLDILETNYGYAFVGYISNYKCLFFTTDVNFNVIASKTYNFQFSSGNYQIHSKSNGSYLITSSAYNSNLSVIPNCSNNNMQSFFQILEIDTLGNTISTKVPCVNNFQLKNIQSIDDGYLITGTAQQYNPEFGYIIKLDNDLNISWAKAYDTYANGAIGELNLAIKTWSGDLLAAGKRGNTNDLMLLKVNPTGGLSGCANTSFTISLLNYNFISTIDTVSTTYISNSSVSTSILNNAQSASGSTIINCIDTIPAFYGCSDPTAANYNPLVTIDIGNCDYSCYLPDSIWVSDTTENSFTVSFNSIPNSTNYRVKFKEITSNTWITKYGYSSPITIENLSVATIYDYKFRTTCGSAGNSSWSSVYQITTLNIMGCMDDRAANYNPLATADDGSCDFSCLKRVWAKHLNDQYLSQGNIEVGDLKTLNNDICISLNNFNENIFSFYDNVISDPSDSEKFLVSSISADDSLNWMIYPSSIGGGGGSVIMAPTSSYIRYGISNPSVNPFSKNNPNHIWGDPGYPNIDISKNNEIAIPIQINSVSSFNLGLQTFIPSSNMSQMGFGGINGLCIAKITSNGDVDFLVTINEKGNYDWDADVAFDDYNNVYVTATCYGEDLFAGAQLPGSPQIAEFAYLTKLDYSGNPLFIKKFYDPIGTSTSVPFVGQGFDVPIPSGKMIITDNSLFLPLLLRDTVLFIDGDTTINVSSTSNIFNSNNTFYILNYVLLEFTLTGDFLKLHQNFDYAPHTYFNNKFLSYRTDTIFELDTANLSVIGTHIYPGLSDVQINDDQMILTVGSEMLIVDENFNTIDTIGMVGLYNDGAVYIHNAGGLLGDTVITATGLNMAKYDIYPINPSQQPVTCSNWMDGAVSVNPNLGIPPYTYNWSTGDNTAQVDQLGMGTYSVTVTDSIGCVITDSVYVELDVAPSDSMHPQICYVTVDVNTGYNKIVLKPLESSLTAQYVIYKEGSATVYSPLDTIDANTLTYIDSASNPAVQANRYKVSAIDVCGNISDTSDHHKTVHLTMNTGTNGEVNLIWNIYEGYQVPDYLIYRGNSGSNMNMIATIAGNLSSFTDQAPPTGNLEYQIRALGQVCNPLPNAMVLPDTLESNVITHLNQVSMGIGFFTQDPTCPTCSDGYIIASAYGGIAPYTYIWTNGLSGYFLGGLPAGTYTVIAFDNAGNQASASVTLGASGPILGCTDMAATNYDATATIDDGSCSYTTCGVVTGVNLTNIIQDRVTFNWDNMNSSSCQVDQIRFRYREVGTNSYSTKTMGVPVGSGCNTSNTSKVVLGLNPSTTYEYDFKLWYCNAPTVNWHANGSFTTADVCINAANMTTTPLSTTKTEFCWHAPANPWSFVRLQYRENVPGSSFSNIGGFGVMSPALCKNKNGLTPGTEYRVMWRTWCSLAGGPYRSPVWDGPVIWTQPTVIRLEGGTTINNLAIYPNPSRDVFNISFTSENIQDLRVRIMNVIGEELINDNLEQFIGVYTKQINLSDNAKGIYFLEIEMDDGVVNKKLILQ